MKEAFLFMNFQRKSARNILILYASGYFRNIFPSRMFSSVDLFRGSIIILCETFSITHSPRTLSTKDAVCMNRKKYLPHISLMPTKDFSDFPHCFGQTKLKESIAGASMKKWKVKQTQHREKMFILRYHRGNSNIYFFMILIERFSLLYLSIYSMNPFRLLHSGAEFNLYVFVKKKLNRGNHFEMRFDTFKGNFEKSEKRKIIVLIL